MRRTLVPVLAIFALGVLAAPPVLQRFGPNAKPGWSQDRSQRLLFNGWKLSPVGKRVELPGDMPLSIAFSPDGQFAFVNTAGYHDPSLNVVRVETGTIEQTMPLPRAWMGLSMNDNRVLVSGGRADAQAHPALHDFGWDGTRLTRNEGTRLPDTPPTRQFVSGIASGALGTYILNADTNEVLLMGPEGVKARTTVGYRPYQAALLADGMTLAVTLWGDKRVAFLDAATLELKGIVQVESHPTALAATRDGRLFVTCSGGRSVFVITEQSVKSKIDVGAIPGQPIGSTPVALALSPDQRRLYVANAGTNCVAVVDVGSPQAKVLGHIPTDRFPTAVAVTPDGKRLLVATAKGMYGPNKVDSEAVLRHALPLHCAATHGNPRPHRHSRRGDLGAYDSASP